MRPIRTRHIERSLLQRKAKVIVTIAVAADDPKAPAALQALTDCLARLKLLQRATPLKQRIGFALPVTIEEFDRLSVRPEVGHIRPAD